MNNCTFCGKEITDILSKVILDIETFRKREDTTLEKVNNCDWTYIEALCPECLEKVIEAIQLIITKKVKDSNV